MNPYDSLPDRSFWKLAVSQKNAFDVKDLWRSKFDIRPNEKICTFGSCFAQHIGRALKKWDFDWYCPEQPPVGLSESNCKLYNYSIFSARTGNIYTTSLLRQWVEWALGIRSVPDEIWRKKGRFYDPFRPRVEPEGFESEQELRESFEYTLKCFKKCLTESDYFIFTLGLTESWFNESSNYEYPMCPGTAAGVYDKSLHVFKKQEFEFVRKNLAEAIDLIRSINPDIRFILTVSPVPLTATNSQSHVLVATTESKSVLRAVAGQISSKRAYVDYFPSYEIITSPVFRGMFFEPNQRSVNAQGVSLVMSHFYNGLPVKPDAKKEKNSNIGLQAPDEKFDEVCEEVLLEAFGKQ